MVISSIVFLTTEAQITQRTTENWGILNLYHKVISENRIMRKSLFLLGLILFASCSEEGNKLFEKLPVEKTNIAFKNDIPEKPDFNIINYLYYYNGGGVAVGDINNDGLQDVYFSSNLGENKLYLNKGNFQFQDITNRAGVAFRNANWKTGVTMADVNGDGFLDIYASCVSGVENRRGRNALFINNGNMTFTDKAVEFGLAEEGFGQQAAFFDYDKDGDLDAYLLRTSVHSENSYKPAAEGRNVRDPKAGDKLMRNDNGKFTDVSAQAGILGGSMGYGLGIAISDLDNNGFPDVYVANDFHENDYLYFNNGDGTFTENVKNSMPHTSQYSMGTDIGDINNDGLQDVITLDMMPANETIRKTAEGADKMDVYRTKRGFGYHDQLARNALQLNRGNRKFSDIAPLSGVYATDWSWGVLFADLDLDGYKDVFVSNGIYRRPNDLDFLTFISEQNVQRVISKQHMELAKEMPQIKIPNFAFQNKGDLTFADRSKEWGLDDMAYSNGSAYADLDNDGDLDLITNNINEAAGIFKNLSADAKQKKTLTIKLEGEGKNRFGIGAKVIVKTTTVGKKNTQTAELNPTRGWLSSVDPRLFFGIGSAKQVDTLTVIWGDGRFQKLTNLNVDRTLILKQSNAVQKWQYLPEVPNNAIFSDVTAASGANFVHKENDYTDYNREFLMPKMVSREGPALATADVNGDNVLDFYIGGARGKAGQLFLGKSGGTFSPNNQTAFLADSLYEDVSAHFFDADNDSDVDLLVASGGGQWIKEEGAKSRFYLNDGKGNFTRNADALPDLRLNASTVATHDFDDDGDMDIFLGARSVISGYGLNPTSYLLENNGRGQFRDVTKQKAPDLANVGMVRDAEWVDIEKDGKKELIVVGEWMPITIFKSGSGKLTNYTQQAGLDNTFGWWNCIETADLEGDGDQDLVLGNMGLNNIFQATETTPLRLFVKDLDKNGSTDPMMTYFNGDKEYPFERLDDIFQQLPMVRAKYEGAFKKAGSQSFDEMFEGAYNDGVKQQAAEMRSMVLLNKGNGAFNRVPLPTLAQLSPTFAIAIEDFNGDDVLDIVLGGNDYNYKPSMGRYDASYGSFLLGDGRGGFYPISNGSVNLWTEGQVRNMRVLPQKDGGSVVIVAKNNAPMQVLSANSKQ